MTLSALGDSAVVLTLGERVDATTSARVRAVAAEIERRRPTGVVDVVPAFGSIAVFFDPAAAAPPAELGRQLEALAAQAGATGVAAQRRTIEIPVGYGGDFGPDLAAVSTQVGLSADEVIARHSGADYEVQAIGFAPGFPYLAGLPPELAVPRRSTPRPRVPAGSVGIGGAQTGVYPLAIPGGWNLIGCTPLKLFESTRPAPALLRAGDHVKFRAMAPAECHVLRDTFEAGSAERPENRHVMGDTTSGIEVVRAGMFTTVQDLGRPGHRAEGVPLSGAADPLALRLVNLIVGNPENTAALEFTLVGPELKFLHDTVIAVGGGEFGDVPRWRPLPVRAGTTLTFGPSRAGCRGYLALAGGVKVPLVLGSASTYGRAALGGFHGRALRDGDRLAIPTVRRPVRERWRIDERILPPYSSQPTVRVIRGQHVDAFGEGWESALYRVSGHSDRMGVRLEGPALGRDPGAERASSPVAPGTIQVPPDGQPIVLLADAQTIGGYPQLAHVVSVDLPLVAHLRPGDRVRFRAISVSEAHELLAARERAFALVRAGIAEKLA